MNGKVALRRDRIQFEGLDYPDDGNSYSRQAASAWECAAIEFIERAGYEADVDAGYGKDHTRCRKWVSATEKDEDGDRVDLTDAEEHAALQIAEAADSAGWEAAEKFAAETAKFADPD